MKTKPTIIAIDIETTGLDPKKHKILEVSMHELDENFNIVTSFDGILQYHDAIEHIDPIVVEMHINNGLFHFVDDLPIVSTDSHADCDLWHIEDFLNNYEKIIFLGNSVQFDRSFIETHIPSIKPRLHYRNFDVRTLLMTLDISHLLPPFTSIHRAKSDVTRSIAIASKYKELLSLGLDNYNYINTTMR